MQENSFWIAVAIAACVYVKRVIGHHRKRQALKCTYTCNVATTRGQEKTEDQIREDLTRARLRQQEMANEKAHDAEKVRKEKEAKERERRNACAKPSDPKGGSKLGGGSGSSPSTTPTTSTGYNPMQPWSSSGGGYR
jgi:preprotein translocase subunit SecF